MYTILGAGLSGLSIAWHLQRLGIPFEVYEAKIHGGGHIHSEEVDGFIWDEGPHVSFTKYEYVKQFFANNCKGEYLEYPTMPTNYFEGNWIPHPAQSNMYAVPEPLRSRAVADVVNARHELPTNYNPLNYQEWINFAFGKTFSETFSQVYTKKYWTTEPENLSTDWIGKRIYFPEITDMVDSSKGPLNKQTHYISKVRYPKNGGFYSFINEVEQGLAINYNRKLTHISFTKKELTFQGGEVIQYEKLVSSLPLPQLLLSSDAPEAIKTAARKLKCSHVLIVNVVVDHPAPIENHWIYVYDKDFYSTRINFTELLSPENGQPNRSGIQVEAYFSEYHPLNEPIEKIEQAVLKELIEMKLVRDQEHILSHHHKWVDWANVIFDNERVAAQEEVLAWLATQGLVREDDDLKPMTDWDEKAPVALGNITLAGRFAQWKYYWTDDCVMRAKHIAESIERDIKLNS